MLLQKAPRAQKNRKKHPPSFICRVSGAYLETGQARKLMFLYQPQRTSNSSALITCKEPVSSNSSSDAIFMLFFNKYLQQSCKKNQFSLFSTDQATS